MTVATHRAHHLVALVWPNAASFPLQAIGKLLNCDSISIELDDGKIYRKALYLMVKTMVSCKFSLKPIQWHQHVGYLMNWCSPTFSGPVIWPMLPRPLLPRCLAFSFLRVWQEVVKLRSFETLVLPNCLDSLKKAMKHILKLDGAIPNT